MPFLMPMHPSSRSVLKTHYRPFVCLAQHIDCAFVWVRACMPRVRVGVCGCVCVCVCVSPCVHSPRASGQAWLLHGNRRRERRSSGDAGQSLSTGGGAECLALWAVVTHLGQGQTGDTDQGWGLDGGTHAVTVPPSKGWRDME